MTDHITTTPEATGNPEADALRACLITLANNTNDPTSLQGGITGLRNGGNLPPPQTIETEQRQRKTKGYTKNPLRLAITEFLQQAQGGEATEDEVVSGVRKHCVRDEDKAKKQVHAILSKNSYHYRRLPNENWALRR